MKSNLVCAALACVALALSTTAAFATVDQVHTNELEEFDRAHPVVLPHGCPKGEVASTNPTTGKQECVKPDMAVKGSGVPKNASKNITDGAAKGQASELTATAPDKGCAKDNGSLSTYRTTDSASPSVACKKLPGKMKSGTIPN
jgi:hypothetical protein